MEKNLQKSKTNGMIILNHTAGYKEFKRMKLLKQTWTEFYLETRYTVWAHLGVQHI